MLGWLVPKPKPPVDTIYKAWVETRMLWLADQFGIERMHKAKVLRPIEDDFPNPYDGTAEAVPPILDRLCGVMAIDPRSIKLEIVDSQQMPGAVGQYESSAAGPAVIRLAESSLGDFQGVVATLAHELSHEILLGRGLISVEEEDHEHVTDLLPVFLGLGIFSANATVADQATRQVNREIWQIRRQGYLPSHVQGYALALFASLRGERNPDWSRHLRLDARAALAAGLKYLEKTEDTLFHPQAVTKRSRELSVPSLVETLRTGTPSARLAALWQLRPRVPGGADLLEAVLARLEDADQDIRAEAASLVGTHGLVPERSPELLIRALGHSSGRARASIAWALGHFRQRAEGIVPHLINLLGEPDELTVYHAAAALGEFSTEAYPAVHPLLDALTLALIDCRYAMVDGLAASLRKIVPDPRPVLDDYYADRDPELRGRACAALESAAAFGSSEPEA
jgi:hypothetical protein